MEDLLNIKVGEIVAIEINGVTHNGVIVAVNKNDEGFTVKWENGYISHEKFDYSKTLSYRIYKKYQ